MSQKMIRVRLADPDLRVMRHDMRGRIEGERDVPDLAYYRRAIRRGELELVEPKAVKKKSSRAASTDNEEK